MRSPFPGVDPYIESSGLWADFHSKLIGEMERALSSLVPDRYVVRTGERAYVAIGVSSADDAYGFLPDVALASPHGADMVGPTSTPSQSATEPDAAPVLMQALAREEHREVFLEIHQAGASRRLITGIEILSPSNKRPGTRGWRLYTLARTTIATSTTAGRSTRRLAPPISRG